MKKYKYLIASLFSVFATRLLIPISSAAASGDEAKGKLLPFISNELKSWFWVIAAFGFVLFAAGLFKIQSKQGKTLMGIGFMFMVMGVSFLSIAYDAIKF